MTESDRGPDHSEVYLRAAENFVFILWRLGVADYDDQLFQPELFIGE